MKQLDLFGSPAPPPPPAPPPEAEQPPAIDVSGVLPGQVGLFDPRTMLLGRVRAAVAAADLDAACRDLDALRARCPDDVQVAREALEIRTLRDRLAGIEGPRVKQRARRLRDLANELAPAAEPLASLRRRLLARVAAEIRREHGDAGELAGRLAGEYLLDAGDLQEAHASLAAAFTATGEARALFLFADATLLLGDRTAARRAYLKALLLDPFHPALDRSCDEEVRALPDAARDEAEIEDEPRAWSAPAGILLGVLPRPAPEEATALPPPPASLSTAQTKALVRARAFVETLAAASTARGDAAVEVRRAMKRLSPQLFGLYMDRVVRSRPG